MGTASPEAANSISADEEGNVYVCGFTTGTLGASSAGVHDVFVTKFDSRGVLLWTKQLGTSAIDLAGGVVADGMGNVYLSGSTEGTLRQPNSGTGAQS